MPERDDGPPPGFDRTELTGWALREIAFATCEGEIRGAMHVLMANVLHEPQRTFVRYVWRRLLEVGATAPNERRA